MLPLKLKLPVLLRGGIVIVTTVVVGVVVVTTVVVVGMGVVVVVVVVVVVGVVVGAVVVVQAVKAGVVEYSLRVMLRAARDLSQGSGLGLLRGATSQGPG